MAEFFIDHNSQVRMNFAAAASLNADFDSLGETLCVAVDLGPIGLGEQVLDGHAHRRMKKLLKNRP